MLLKNVRCKNGCAVSSIGKVDLLFGFNDSISFSLEKFITDLDDKHFH